MSANDAAGWLQQHILTHIPLARAMQLAVVHYGGAVLELTAPLAPNRNDKGCAFGGSMASLLTLAGWGLVELGLREQGLECDIYVGDSQLRYRQPLWDTLHARARFVEADALTNLVAALRARGKGACDVTCEIIGDGQAAATLTARFFARPRAAAGDPAQSSQLTAG